MGPVDQIREEETQSTHGAPEPAPRGRGFQIESKSSTNCAPKPASGGFQCQPESTGVNYTSQIIHNTPTKPFNLDNSEGLKIWYTNADTLTGEKINELTSRIRNEHPDIIAITETNPKNSMYDLTDMCLNIDGYELMRSNSSRGVCIYTASHLLVNKIDLKSNFEESLWCKIMTGNKVEVLFGCIYRSPNSNAENNLALLDLISEATTVKADHLIITGDFNLKEIDWNNKIVHGLSSSYAHKTYDVINDLFLTECIKQCTRFRGTNKPSALDWALTYNEDLVENLDVQAPLGLSDHSLVSFTFNCISNKPGTDDSMRRSYYNGNYDEMRKDLSFIDWDKEFHGLNAQQCWDNIQSKINGLIERHIPMKKYTTSKSPPWYGRTVRDLSDKKKKAWNKYKKRPTPETWASYANHRNILTHHIESSKSDYDNKIASEIKDNPKQFWKYVNRKTKSKGKISSLINSEGDLVTDDAGKAEILNKQFVSVFTVEDMSNMPTLDLEDKKIKIMEDIPVTIPCLTKHLQKLNISKSCGPDGINARILKENACELAPALKILFELSMDESTVPKQWKQAHVTALFKKGNKKIASNYRPVSLTSICCKLFEKIVRDAIVKNLEEQGLISKSQHGFRGGRSCTTQLLEVMEIWTGWFDKGLPWDSIYTDFAKAFDSVPHQRLLNKIHAYGIRGKILKWIEDFLSERTQRVVVGNEKSEWANVTSGIPQGSVLGPILFTIFINDMPELVKSVMKLFADDAKIFKAIESFHDISMIQDDIDKLLTWSKKWQLPLNISKCKVIHYGKDNPQHKYTMDGSDLFTDTEEKDVGVLFDSSLTFRKHIRNMVAKANSRIGMIKRSFSMLSIQNFKLLYKSLVRPILEYCSSIWFPLYKGDVQEIEKVQRRATKLVKQIRNMDYPDRLKALKLTTLTYRRKRTDVLQVYRIINKIDNLNFEDFFKRNEMNTRGHDWKLVKPWAGSKLRQNTFSYRVINDWNSLPAEVINSPSINSFKNALEKHWKNNSCKYNFDDF